MAKEIKSQHQWTAQKAVKAASNQYSYWSLQVLDVATQYWTKTLCIINSSLYFGSAYDSSEVSFMGLH